MRATTAILSLDAGVDIKKAHDLLGRQRITTTQSKRSGGLRPRSARPGRFRGAPLKACFTLPLSPLRFDKLRRRYCRMHRPSGPIMISV
jgi:hypothetical protein